MDRIRSIYSDILARVSVYLGTDLAYVTRGSFWLISSQLIGTVLAFILSIVFANILPKETYGEYRYVLSVASIIGAFSLTGLNTAIIQSVARGFEGVLRSSFKLNLKWNIFGVVISLIGSAYYLFKGNQTLGVSLIIIAAITPFLNSATLFTSFLNGKKDFKRLGVYNTLDNAIPNIALIICAYVTQNVLILVFTYFVTNMIMAVYFYWRTLQVYTPSDNNDPDIARYSIRLSFLNIIGILTAHIDKILVFTFLGSAELAIYGIAMSFPEQIKSLLRNLNSLMIPRLSTKDYADGKLHMKRKVWQLLLGVSLITVVYILCAPFLYSIFFPQYIESVHYSRLFAISILATVAMIPNAILISQKKELELFQAGIGGSIIQIAILVPSAYFGGLMGVVVAKTISAYVVMGIAFLMVKRNYEL